MTDQPPSQRPLIGFNSTFLANETGTLFIRELDTGRLELRGEARDPRVHVPHSPCITSYPLDLIRLIFSAYGATYTCDEISRDIDETEAALDVRYSVVAYFDEEVFARPHRILDYGCGAGSSTVTLSRLFPHARLIVGMDFVEQFLSIARSRVSHYGITNVQFEKVSSGENFQKAGEEYDLVFLNAVYEHLLPSERPTVLANLWSVLKPGGALILNQTPHRWFPIETHTSGLPLINYLPDAFAFWTVRKFSKREISRSSWDQLLRAGVRGASVREIMRHIKKIDTGASRLKPLRLSTSWAGIWYAAKRARLRKLGRPLLRAGIVSTEWLVRSTRLPISPYINIAVSKRPAGS